MKINDYAHDFRDMAMTEEELRKMLLNLSKEVFRDGAIHAYGGAGLTYSDKTLEDLWNQYSC